MIQFEHNPEYSKLISEISLDAPLTEVFDFFSKAENLERLTPDFLNFKILTPLPIVMNEGVKIDYSIKLFGFPLKWRTLIDQWVPNSHFVDIQIKGPYSLWHHTHSFQEKSYQNSKGEIKTYVLMTDTVKYQVPLSRFIIGFIAKKLFVEPNLKTIFNYRRDKITSIFKEFNSNLSD